MHINSLKISIPILWKLPTDKDNIFEKIKQSKIFLDQHVTCWFYTNQIVDIRGSYQQRIFWPFTDIRRPWAEGASDVQLNLTFSQDAIEEWIFFIVGSFGTISLSIFWWRHQMRQKTPKIFLENSKKSLGGGCGVSWKCVQQQQLLGVPAGRQLLVLLQCAKVGLDGMHYESRSTFFSLVPLGKEKNQFAKCSFLIFWKQVNECKTFPGCCVKNSYIFRN